MSAAHIQSGEGFGEEAVLKITASDCTRTNAGGIGDATFGGDYVRVVSADGREIAYWEWAEWAEDPQVVMGAIFGACSGIEPRPDPAQRDRPAYDAPFTASRKERSPMFNLNEEKLRAAFADPDKDFIEPFDPWQVGADDLHGLIGCLLGEQIIERGHSDTAISIFPLSENEPRPIVAVNPGAGLCLLGPEVRFPEVSPSDNLEDSIEVLRDVVEDANALYASLVTLIEESTDGR